jgi:hypothetical protein
MYKDLIKPFQDFILYKSFMLVAHGNILSYYDIDEERWMKHHKFSEAPADVTRSSISLNKTYAYIIKKKVVSVFRHEIHSSDV